MRIPRIGWSILLALFACTANFAQTTPAFPLKASADGRYLVDQENQPFFYNADSPWLLPKRLSLKEAEEFFEERIAQGFNAVQVHTISKEVTPAADRGGNNPFEPLNDILKPNEDYWKNLESVVAAAEKRHLVVALSAIWIQWGGHDTSGWRYQLSEGNARAYGQFLGKRFGRFPNVIWVLGGDANPIEITRAISDLGEGIHEVAPHQPITVHNKPGYASATFFDATSWLGVNLVYTYEEAYIPTLGEYNRIGKTRPIILGESGYELESNDGRGGSTFRVRRQAYEAVLSGALGGHAYGHRDIWQMNEHWREAVHAPGARQIGYFKQLFTSLAWYELVPDQENRVVVSGRGVWGDLDYVTAAITRDRRFAVIYIPESRPIGIDLGQFMGSVRARWFDPSDGRFKPASEGALLLGDPHIFTPPSTNAAGDRDFVLVLQPAGEN
jgi:Protein of unknown function (DUF4038)/Putative collagen-binding domain of a collagenase